MIVFVTSFLHETSQKLVLEVQLHGLHQFSMAMLGGPATSTEDLHCVQGTKELK